MGHRSSRGDGADGVADRGDAKTNAGDSGGATPASDERLTILLLATTFPRWEGDSVPQFVAELARTLESHRLDVVVLAPHAPGAARRESMDGVTVYRYPYFVPYRYQCLLFRGKGGLLPTLKDSALAALQVPLLVASLLGHAAWVIHREDVDVVNSHWLLPNGLAGVAVASAFSLPHVLTLHARGVLVARRLPLGSRLVTFVADHSDRILPVSTHIRDAFVDAGGERVAADDRFTVRPMGTDTDALDPAANPNLGDDHGDEDEVRALFVGRLAAKKGVEYLLEAARDVVGTHPDLHLVVVGTGPLEEPLRESAAAHDLEDAVTFTGWVSEAELREEYAAADFMVVPSIETSTGDTEGMPTVIAEAFAAGNPVVATGVGGIPDVVDDGVNGYVVDQRRPEALADGMRTLLEDPETRSTLSAAARASAERLDWDRCADVYADSFRAARADRVTGGVRER